MATVHGDAEVTTESVRTQLDGVLARYKLPKNVIVVEDLPRTASGKIRKADLRARFGRTLTRRSREWALVVTSRPPEPATSAHSRGGEAARAVLPGTSGDHSGGRVVVSDL